MTTPVITLAIVMGLVVFVALVAIGIFNRMVALRHIKNQVLVGCGRSAQVATQSGTEPG